MFRKILIANRGEIAVRIIRTCRQMGIKTIGVYSEADRNLLHAKLADESICIGPPPAAKSYLNVASIMSAASLTGAQAVHPGYGFLAENMRFAEICQSHNIYFIGPSSEAMGILGDKASARLLAEKLHVPVIPGSGVLSQVSEAQKFAKQMGYPLMIKAAAGGGGKGMRFVQSDKELEKSFPLAQAEALASFGDGRLYLEKYLVEPRHIEVQILGDSQGHLVAVGERECSLQRQHQKIIEEAPSAVITRKEREKLYEMAVKIARGVHYVGAGTVEFLRDAEGRFYFIEANARIQVEHPVTEMVTGFDLVREQILAAAGEPMTIRQENVNLEGHAVECRINAEDPKSFAPSTGIIEKLHWPGGFGVRVDSHLRQGDRVTPFYDSMLGKLIAWGKNRKEALARISGALEECQIQGIKTNLPLHKELLQIPEILEGKLDVGLVERLLAEKAFLKGR